MKKAVIVGINKYASAPLRGCVNDAVLVSEMLTKHFGFETKNKRMLTDESATTANILERLNWLVNGATPGDILYFHFSGHGSQLIDTDYDNDKEPDRRDEIICPVDIDWREKVIRDDDLKEIFDRVPPGVHVTVVLDCCHSGSGMDQEYQYQPLGVAARGREFGPDSPNRARLLPMPADIENRGLGLDLPVRPRSVKRSVDNDCVMISGCQSHQTSADAWIDNRFIGAATHALVKTLEQHNYEISYKELVDEMNEFMVNHNFTQRPEFNGDQSLKQEKFIPKT